MKGSAFWIEGSVKERPLLLGSAWAHLAAIGRKTQTRRPVPARSDSIEKCPFAEVGDRLYVRETFLPCKGTPYTPIRIGEAKYVCFKDGSQKYLDGTYIACDKPVNPLSWPKNARWRPSIHLPRWASRLILEVTEVRLEPVASISAEDAVSEGVASPAVFGRCWDMIYGQNAPFATSLCWAITFTRIVP